MSSYGLGVQGPYGVLPIDEDYHNFVKYSQGRTYVSTGVREIKVTSSPKHSLEIAVRHPEITVVLLSYLHNSSGIYGARVYVSGSGYIYWKAFVEHYTLPLKGTGMVIYDAVGTQVFHSDHRYADVFNVSATSNAYHYVGDSYYLLLLPGVVEFDYSTIVTSSSYPLYGNICSQVQVPYTYRTTETQCSYVYSPDPFEGGYVCETVYVTRTAYKYERQCVYGQVGVSYTYYAGHYLTKHVTGIHQTGTQLRTRRIRITKDQFVYGYITGSSMETGPTSFLPGFSGIPYNISNAFNLSKFSNKFISVK